MLHLEGGQGCHAIKYDFTGFENRDDLLYLGPSCLSLSLCLSTLSLGSVPGGVLWPAGTLRPYTHSHAHTLLNDSDPGAPVVPGCRVDLVHFRWGRTDQKHPFLLVGDVPYD